MKYHQNILIVRIIKKLMSGTVENSPGCRGCASCDEYPLKRNQREAIIPL